MGPDKPGDPAGPAGPAGPGGPGMATVSEPTGNNIEIDKRPLRVQYLKLSAYTVHIYNSTAVLTWTDDFTRRTLYTWKIALYYTVLWSLTSDM